MDHNKTLDGSTPQLAASATINLFSQTFAKSARERRSCTRTSAKTAATQAAEEFAPAGAKVPSVQGCALVAPPVQKNVAGQSKHLIQKQHNEI